MKRGARGGKRAAKGKGTAVTTAALIQYGSGTVAYATKLPHLEYSEEESNLLGEAMADAFGTLSSKKAKAINAFLSKWGPWISLGGVMMATTMPKYQMTRAVLAERRAANRERARNAVHTREAQVGASAATIGIETAPGGMGSASAGAGIGIEGTDGAASSVGSDFGGAG